MRYAATEHHYWPSSKKMNSAMGVCLKYDSKFIAKGAGKLPWCNGGNAIIIMH